MVLWLEMNAGSSLTGRIAGVASLSALAALGTSSESVGPVVVRAPVVTTVAVPWVWLWSCSLAQSASDDGTV